MPIPFETHLPKMDIYHDNGHAEKSDFRLIYEVGLLACGLMLFDVVYPR